ncbi:MAG: hypothetical protein IT182_11565 [Acidobacteria bacterium]|nr:hypothetical protein [Acidobacteriota bacterium]
MTLATRLRALWLLCLLVVGPAGPLGLILSGHAAGENTHVLSIVHDPADHGIAPGALPEGKQEEPCLFCQAASSLSIGCLESAATFVAPDRSAVSWIDSQAAAPRAAVRSGLPARAPPAHA